MFRFFSAVLDKMGNWFGIVFKIILPAIVMYRPIKMAGLAVLVFGTALGGNSESLSNLGIFIFYILYAIFVLMLFLFPKVASAMEFVLMSCYFVCLFAFKYIDFFGSLFADMNGIVSVYMRAVPVILLFLLGKILFYIFIRVNRDKIEEGRRAKFERFNSLR